MAGGDAIQIGPWIGGLNTYSDETAVADNQAVIIENLELDLDGSLVSRPPIVDIGVSFPLGATGNMQLLGYYYAPGSVPYLLASDGLGSTYYYTGTNWVLLTNTIAATAMVQFDGKAWLLSPVGAANPGGYWTPAGGFVADANMPHGEVIVAYKFRLWVAIGRTATTNGTRMYFSKVLGTTPFWPAAPDFIDVGSGDGQNIVQIVVYFQSLVIFRTDSTYSFQFTSDPAAGQTSLILPGTGLADKDAIVSFQSYLYFMYEDKAFEFVNNRASQINVSVPFQAVNRTNNYKPFAVSVFGNRAIFSYYDTMFVFSLNTRTWTTWVSPTRGSIGRIISLSQQGTFEQAIAHSSQQVPGGGGRTAKTLRITDGLTTDAETFQCTLQTKNYNYNASSANKRLFMWGADAIFRSNLVAIVTPIVYNYSVTWGQLLAFTWGQLKSFTWGQPISGTLSITTTRAGVGGGALRKFVKLGQSLRFRQANFKLIFDTDGSTSAAPVRIFSLTTYVKVKERVVKTVN
jgi:hypothetical protein